MRRKTDKEIRKSFVWLIIISLFFICAGLFMICLQWIAPTTEYGELMEKEIVVSDLEYKYQYKAANYYLLTTTDNEKYHVAGKFDSSELKEELKEDVSATIKFSENKLFFRKYAEEIYVGENRIVEYNNDEDNSLVIRIIFGSISLLIGCGGLVWYHWEIKHNRKINEKRDAKIRKKYGDARKMP